VGNGNSRGLRDGTDSFYFKGPVQLRAKTAGEVSEGDPAETGKLWNSFSRKSKPPAEGGILLSKSRAKYFEKNSKKMSFARPLFHFFGDY
jgi:hypothetical protein